MQRKRLGRLFGSLTETGTGLLTGGFSIPDFFCRSMLLSSRRELGLIMKFMGEALTEREIQMIIDEADVDHDGLIDYTEFFSMMNPK